MLPLFLCGVRLLIKIIRLFMFYLLEPNLSLINQTIIRRQLIHLALFDPPSPQMFHKNMFKHPQGEGGGVTLKVEGEARGRRGEYMWTKLSSSFPKKNLLHFKVISPTSKFENPKQFTCKHLADMTNVDRLRFIIIHRLLACLRPLLEPKS